MEESETNYFYSVACLLSEQMSGKNGFFLSADGKMIFFPLFSGFEVPPCHQQGEIETYHLWNI